MKKISLFLALICISFLSSCDTMGGGTQGSPDATMTSFVEKMKAQDFAGAKEFTSNTTDGSMDFLAIRVQMLKEMKKEDQIPGLFGGVDFSQIKLETCVTTDKRATCKCCEEVTGTCKDIVVIQEGGKWLVDMPKESTVE